MSTDSLFAPAIVGSWELANRVVMAPMTRCRAQSDWSPSPYAAEYYGQRNTAGLIITEATYVGPAGTGYIRTPGIWNETHADRWREIVRRIHQGPAKAVVQLWNVGRIAHSYNMPKGCVPMGASPVAPRIPMYTDFTTGMVEIPVPRQMTDSDIRGAIDDFRKAATFAKAAGFDGVEIHGANGYLVEQFAASNTNLRTDEWGGTLEKRLRFMAEVLAAVSTVYDRSRVGIRISPFGTFNDIADADPAALFKEQLRVAAAANIGYVHIIRPQVTGDVDQTAPEPGVDVVGISRQLFPNVLIAAGGYDAPSAQTEISAGRADFIAFGRPFVANPDLVSRLKGGIALSSYRQDLLYVPGPEGYIDYKTA